MHRIHQFFINVRLQLKQLKVMLRMYYIGEASIYPWHWCMSSDGTLFRKKSGSAPRYPASGRIFNIMEIIPGYWASTSWPPYTTVIILTANEVHFEQWLKPRGSFWKDDSYVLVGLMVSPSFLWTSRSNIPPLPHFQIQTTIGYFTVLQSTNNLRII